jgi:hypothetical protein
LKKTHNDFLDAIAYTGRLADLIKHKLERFENKFNCQAKIILINSIIFDKSVLTSNMRIHKLQVIPSNAVKNVLIF